MSNRVAGLNMSHRYMKPTPKERVQTLFPEAVALYDGLMGWHVRNGSGGAYLSIGFGSSAAAWADAAKSLRRADTTTEGKS